MAAISGTEGEEGGDGLSFGGIGGKGAEVKSEAAFGGHKGACRGGQGLSDPGFVLLGVVGKGGGGGFL